jgi:hypothetical protein
MVRRVTSRCPSVLVKETADTIDPDDLSAVRFTLHLSDRNRRSLAQALVWASRVVVVDELQHHTLELAWPKDE